MHRPSSVFGLARSPLGGVEYRAFHAHGTPDEVAQAWVNAMSQAATKATAGANAVTVSPGQSAANALQKWVQALASPQVQQKWQTQVGAVTLASWQQAYINKGVPRMASGASNAQAKFTAAMTSLLRFIDAGVAQVKSMPSATYADRENRMLTFVRYMHTYQKPAGT